MSTVLAALSWCVRRTARLASAADDGPVALLDELYVAPPWRDRGIGSALLVAVESTVRERGALLVEINVDDPDIDARRFYERHGYTDIEPGQQGPARYYSRELGIDRRHGADVTAHAPV